MTTTSFVNLLYIEESSEEKETNMNTDLDDLAGLAGGYLSVDLTAESGNVPITELQFKRAKAIFTSGPMAASVNLILPTTISKDCIVFHNATGFDLIVKPSGGAGVTISPAGSSWIFSNGTNAYAPDPTAVGSVAIVSKTRQFATGNGANPITVPGGVKYAANSLEVFVDGASMFPTYDYNETESVPAAGYDQITPIDADSFPVGSVVMFLFYAS